MSLDIGAKEFEKAVQKTSDLIEQLYEELDSRKVYPGKSPAEVQELFEEALPGEGTGLEQLLDKVQHDVIGSATLNVGPRYYGYITGGGNQVAVLAEMIKAALNQNNLKWHSSPVSTELERLVMRWVAAFIGYPVSSAGVLLSGGSVANLNCLAVARKIKAPADVSSEGVYGSRPLTVYVSEEGHSSLDKAMDILGLGKKYLRKIPVDEQMRIDPDKLEEKIRMDKNSGIQPICAVAVAGTTNTGAVDDLKAVAEICQKHGLWYHVDAAYGGPAAKLPGKAGMFEGIAKADSVVVNPHKWLYVPFEAGGVLVKDPDHLRETFSAIPDYLKSDRQSDGRTDLMEYNLPLTKDFKALKVWMTLKAYGAERLRTAIASDIEKADYLSGLVTSHDQLELMAPVPLSIVCFRYNPGNLKPDELDRLNDRLIDEIEQDGRVFLTGTRIKGRTALRVCLINHRTKKSDLDFLIGVVEEIAAKLVIQP